jgi:hypothetical protein
LRIPRRITPRNDTFAGAQHCSSADLACAVFVFPKLRANWTIILSNFWDIFQKTATALILWGITDILKIYNLKEKY